MPPCRSPSRRALLTTVAALLVATAMPGTRAGEQLSEPDRSAIRAVIEAQLAAFQADDARLAFSFASPDVQRKTGSPKAFMEMVRQSYKPVYRPRAVFFQNVTIMDGVPAQRVLVMDANGAPVLAVYPMERQADGSWRIAGCMLYRGSAHML